MADDADWRATWLRLLPLYFHHYDPQIGEAMDAVTSYSAAAWNHVNVHCLPFFNTVDRLKDLAVPTLVLSGGDDWITPAAQGQRLLAGLPNAQLTVFENSGHFPFVEETEAYLAAVRDWLARLD
jgi:proline iminopeptidase